MTFEKILIILWAVTGFGTLLIMVIDLWIGPSQRFVKPTVIGFCAFLVVTGLLSNEVFL